jgi:uncharacterized Rmd1/YagE family protein
MGAPMPDNPPAAETRRRVRALLLSDRIDTSNLERDGAVSNSPLAYRYGSDGLVTVFRYGVVVLVNLTPEQEAEVLGDLQPRLIRPVQQRDEEIAFVEASPDKDGQIRPGGPISLKALTPEALIVIADAMSKSVVLARNEREVATALDIVEPLARELADHGRTLGGRRTILKHIGNALLVQHRVSGRAAVIEKPEVVWERPDLDRLYGRLEDEFELKERAEILSRKLTVIAETAKVLTDIIDTRRALRLELIIVILIAVEIVIGVYQFLIR